MFCSCCGCENVDSAAFCKKCGRSLKKENIIYVEKTDKPGCSIAGFVFFILIVFFGLISDNDDKHTYNSSSNNATPKYTVENSFRIEKHNICGYSNNSICGIATNISDKKYSHVSINIKLYDEYGNLIDNISDSISDIQPSDTWKFEAIGLKNFYQYEIDGFSGW